MTPISPKLELFPWAISLCDWEVAALLKKGWKPRTFISCLSLTEIEYHSINTSQWLISSPPINSHQLSFRFPEKRKEKTYAEPPGVIRHKFLNNLSFFCHFTLFLHVSPTSFFLFHTRMVLFSGGLVNNQVPTFLLLTFFLKMNFSLKYSVSHSKLPHFNLSQLTKYAELWNEIGIKRNWLKEFSLPLPHTKTPLYGLHW